MWQWQFSWPLSSSSTVDGNSDRGAAVATAVSILKVLWYLMCGGAGQGCGVECHPVLHVIAFPSSHSSQMSP